MKECPLPLTKFATYILYNVCNMILCSIQHFDQISQQLWYGKFMLKDKLLIYHLLI